MDLNHFHLQTRDLAKSVDFYTTVFGFRIDATVGPDRIFLKNPKGFFLGLHQVQDPVPLPEWFHFGFGCRNKSELMEAHQRCAAWAGAETTDPRTDDDPMAFYCVDPAGNQIEVFCKRDGGVDGDL